jgi:fatty acid desaturase
MTTAATSAAPVIDPGTGEIAAQPTHGSAFAGLKRQITDAGLLHRRPGYYTAKIAITVAAYLAVWAAFVWLGDSWLQVITAVALGLMFTQVAFLGHDGGHRQVFSRRRGNDTLGLLVGDLLVGLSFGWWLDKHNRHHAHPNQEDHDPDISGGALAFSSGQAERRSTRLSRWLTRGQAWFFFPMLTLEGLNLHADSVRHVFTMIRSRRSRYAAAEAVLLAVHIVGYLTLLFVVLSPARALVFLVIQQGVFGAYMGCSFAPNHKGMPILDANTEADFLSRQVITSRNVRGGRFTDLALGGLNYQIEHHLFPSMPRPNLRRAQPIVRAYCHSMQLPYAETSLIGSYVLVLRHLHDVAAPLRVHTAD